MRYLANKHFRVRFPGQEGIDYNPNDEIPEFDAWPELAKRSHLETGYVRSVMGDGDALLSPKELEDIRRIIRAFDSGIQGIDTMSGPGSMQSLRGAPPYADLAAQLHAAPGEAIEMTSEQLSAAQDPALDQVAPELEADPDFAMPFAAQRSDFLEEAALKDASPKRGAKAKK